MPTERARFVLEAERSFYSFSELCRRYGITRRTGHKWVERYQAEGLADWRIAPTGLTPALT